MIKNISTAILFFSFQFAFAQSSIFLISAPNNSKLKERSYGKDWNKGNNSFSSDDKYARVEASYFGQISNYIIFNDFNFQIPENSVINGISFNMERSGFGMNQEIVDVDVRLIRNNQLVGENKANNNIWSYIDEEINYGGRLDRWNTELSASEINTADFGIAIAVKLNGSEVLPIAQIDYVSMTIYYSTALPVKILSFSADKINTGLVELNWSTDSEINNDYFAIERSVDGQSWEQIAKVLGHGNSSKTNEYQFRDILTISSWLYYRLMQVDFNGAVEYSSIKAVKGLTYKYIEGIYPNPSRGNLNIKTIEQVKKVSIYDSRGILIAQDQLNGASLSSFNLRIASKGIGVIKVETIDGNIAFEKFIYE